MGQNLKEIIIHDGMKHYKINETEISYFQTIAADVRVTDDDFINMSIPQNLYKSQIKIPLEKVQFEEIISKFNQITNRWDTLKYSGTCDLYWTIKTIDYNNKVKTLFCDEYPGNWFELEKMLLDYIISEKFDYIEEYIVASLIYYVLAVKDDADQNLGTCLAALKYYEYFSKVKLLPTDHPASKMYAIINYYMNNLSDLDFNKLVCNIEFKISQYMKNSNHVDDFLKFESDQDVWNLVYRITSKKSTPNYIFEYSRIVDILENKTNTLKLKVNKLWYWLSDVKAYMRFIERNIPYNKPSEYQIEDEYRQELLRPITCRQIICYKNCLNCLEKNDLEQAFWELRDCLDDGIGRYKKYVSINETLIFQMLLEEFKKYTDNSEEQQPQNTNMKKQDINGFEDITDLIN